MVILMASVLQLKIVEVFVHISGILAFLGEINLTDISNTLFNTKLELNQTKLKVSEASQNSIAIYTQDWSPEEREKQFKEQFVNSEKSDE
jgi:uncharacterized membrane protein YjjP (DUF1212 family)